MPPSLAISLKPSCSGLPGSSAEPPVSLAGFAHMMGGNHETAGNRSGRGDFIPPYLVSENRHVAAWWILPGPCAYRATNRTLSRADHLQFRKDGAISAQDVPHNDREQGDQFMPKFDSAGLLSAIVQHVESGEVLMFAFMDAEALAATRATGKAHFHSRSRGRLWMKGETSGHVLLVEEILVDCDQDALVLKARPQGPACHTGEVSCFYRKLDGEGLARK